MSKAYELLQERWQIMIKNIATVGTTEMMAFKGSFLLNHNHHSLRQSVALIILIKPFLRIRNSDFGLMWLWHYQMFT